MLFKTTKRKFEELINSERYKESGYVIQKISDGYALRDKNASGYVSLSTPGLSWAINDYYFIKCIGSKLDIIKAFNFRVPIIKEIKSIKTF